MPAEKGMDARPPLRPGDTPDGIRGTRGRTHRRHDFSSNPIQTFCSSAALNLRRTSLKRRMSKSTQWRGETHFGGADHGERNRSAYSLGCRGCWRVLASGREPIIPSGTDLLQGSIRAAIVAPVTDGTGNVRWPTVTDRDSRYRWMSRLIDCTMGAGSTHSSGIRPSDVEGFTLHDFAISHETARAHCARTVHEWGYCTATVHIGAAIKASAAAGAFSLARRFSFSRASRFICNFIWEYFLKTCASPWRSICVTHSSATPPALSLVAYVARRS